MKEQKKENQQKNNKQNNSYIHFYISENVQRLQTTRHVQEKTKDDGNHNKNDIENLSIMKDVTTSS